MNVLLPVLSGLASGIHVCVGSKVDPNFVHVHSVAVFRSETRHRVIQNEEFGLTGGLFASASSTGTPVPHQFAVKHIKQLAVVLSEHLVIAHLHELARHVLHHVVEKLRARILVQLALFSAAPPAGL